VNKHKNMAQKLNTNTVPRQHTKNDNLTKPWFSWFYNYESRQSRCEQQVETVEA